MTVSRTFSHRDPGTSEATWLPDSRWDSVPRLSIPSLLNSFPRVVLIAPHPDDETLAVGATIADLADRDVQVVIVIATHGGRHPTSVTRQQESAHAVAALSERLRIVWWDFPDGDLRAHEAGISERIADLIDGDVLLIAPVDGDGHADHEAVARAAATAASRCEAALLHYPVWLWHWAQPDQIDWARLRLTAPTLPGLHRKRAAINCYTSQLTAGDDLPILGPTMLERARRLFETFILPATPSLSARVEAHTDSGADRTQLGRPFDAMLTGGDTDPWKLETSAYERRRLGIVLACLGRCRYSKALEIGCATGQLTIALRSRADEAVGLDVSAAALQIAQKHSDQVRWVLGAAPWEIPEEAFDLIVLSEMAYFLDGLDLLTALRAVRRLLRPGGEVVIANWRRATADIPLEGPLVDEQAAAFFDLPRRAHYLDADLSVNVWGSPVSVYDECGSER